MKTLLVIVVIIIVVVGGLMLGGPAVMKKLESLKPQEQPQLVRLQTIEDSPLVEFVSAPGFVEPHTKVEISSEVSARIEALPFEEGAEVKKGEVIIRLDDRELKAALQSAEARAEGEQFRLRSEEARLAGLRTNLEFATRELERMQALYATGDVPKKSLDDVEEQVENLQSNIAATQHSISVIESSLAGAKADIKRASDALDKTVIVAPMEGVIIAQNVEVGEQVLGTFNNMGTAIMTIADLSRMILKAEVAESDIASLREGQESTIHINAYPNEKFRGTVTRIAWQRSISSDGSGVFNVEVEINLEGREIRSGLAASVDVEIAEHRGLSVESQAIVERLIEELPPDIRSENMLIDRTKRTTTVVYRFIDDKAVCTPVIKGPSDLTHTIIVEGLEPDDKVIVGPYKVLETIRHDQTIYDELNPPKPPQMDGEASGETENDDNETSSSEETDA